MTGVLFASFAAIAAVVALGNVLATWQTNRARTAVRSGMENAFDSVALVSQIGRDLARERMLVDMHIAERDRARMAEVEADIAATDHDLDGAVATYQPLVVFPDESVVFRRVAADVVALRAPIADVLALSAQNRDVEAQEQLKLVDVRFARVNADLARLVDINRAGGLGVIARADSAQRAAHVVAAVLALIAIALVIGVGWLATQLVARRETQLVRYAAELEERNRELDAFAGRVAHDLRGPLTAMNMAVQRVLLGIPDDDGRLGPLIKRSVERMERLIRDLLSLSRIEAQSRGAVCDPARAAALMREEQAGRAEGARATLRVDVEPARVRASEGLLVEALSNLADNAAKYARPDVASEIDLRGRVCGGFYELTVADNGIGMSEDEARQAFTPFYRARRGTAPGTGLGLSIVKRVAEVSGGSVAVQSTLGRGSTFVLRLRIAGEGDVG